MGPVVWEPCAPGLGHASCSPDAPGSAPFLGGDASVRRCAAMVPGPSEEWELLRGVAVVTFPQQNPRRFHLQTKDVPVSSRGQFFYIFSPFNRNQAFS